MELAEFLLQTNHAKRSAFSPRLLRTRHRAGPALADRGLRFAMKYHKVHKVLGEGNFVLVASEGEFAGKASAFYDLFRIEHGKIAEHWDTIETIPARSEWKNTNGKF